MFLYSTMLNGQSELAIHLMTIISRILSSASPIFFKTLLPVLGRTVVIILFEGKAVGKAFLNGDLLILCHFWLDSYKYLFIFHIWRYPLNITSTVGNSNLTLDTVYTNWILNFLHHIFVRWKFYFNTCNKYLFYITYYTILV